jgi:DNA repair protein RadD
LRPFPGKTDALILDHASNIERFGRPDDFEYPETLDDGDLDDRSKRLIKDLPANKPCPECAFMVERFTLECPNCGHTIRRPNMVEVADGELVDYDTPAGKIARTSYEIILEKSRFHAELIGYADQQGYKGGWVFHKYKDKFGQKPPWEAPEARTPSGDTQRWIRSQNIRYAKGRAKR